MQFDNFLTTSFLSNTPTFHYICALKYYFDLKKAVASLPPYANHHP